jgi:hypothetical protein
MIIFELDNVLADIEHRRHFVDPRKHPDFYWGKDKDGNDLYARDSQGNYCDAVGNPFKPDWQAFYEACDKDEPITPVVSMLEYIGEGKEYGSDTPWVDYEGIEIWSGRCESVRNKTEKWLSKHIRYNSAAKITLKMRPIGDSTPGHELKERWLNEYLNLPTMDVANCANANTIEMVFESDPESIAMWKRRGIFVFDCRQS